MLQKHFAFSKLADADFGALQVGHDRHFTPCALRRFAHQTGAIDMVLRLAVAEIQPDHVHTGPDHLLQNGGIAGGGSEGGNNFGGAARHMSVS